MRGPKSFTAEDVVEIHLSGAPALLRMVVDLCIREGARPAEPGEFTRRAFLNGRIDLTQAEAVAALIHAQSEAERRAALTVLDGVVCRRNAELSAQLVAVLATLELSLDFSDQDIEIVVAKDLDANLAGVVEGIDDLIAQGQSRRQRADRLRVLLSGPANAGKSSLFNALLGRSQAIVSEQKGTTRDYLEGELDLEGRRFLIIDSAGVDFVGGAVDQKAHLLRERERERADLVVEVRDGRLASQSPKESPALSRQPAEPKFRTAVLRVWTRSDLVPLVDRSRPNGHWVDLGKAGSGAGGLVEFTAALRQSATPFQDSVRSSLLALSERQARLLAKSKEAIERAREGLSRGLGEELLAADLHEALAYFRELSGEDYDDQVLDRIMSDFCIGK